MASFKKQQDRWNRLLRERKYRISVFGLTPHLDWKFILFLSTVALAVIAVAGFGTYKNIVSLSESNITLEPVQQHLVNPDEVNEFVSEFDKKKDRFNALFGDSTVAE